MALPVKTHHEVVADDTGGDFTLPCIEAQAFQYLIGDGHTARGMAFDAAGLGDIVQEQNGVEQRRGFGTEDDLAVALIDVRLAGINRVQFHQAAERVYVGCPAVVEFELHEAVQPRELRHETIKQAMLAQGVKRGVDATALGEHRAEGAAGFFGRGELRRQQVRPLAHQQGQGAVRPGFMDLADTEQAHQTTGIFFEDQAMFGRDGAARHDAQAVHDERSAPPFGLGFAHDRAFDDLGTTADVIGGVKILAHHPADTFGERATIAEAFRHRVLALERKLFRRTGDLKMQFTTQA